MTVLVLILILIAIIAVYPLVRDLVRRKKEPDSAYTEGLSLLLDGKKDEAMQCFKKVVATDSNNIDAYLRLAELYFQKGEIERAAKIYEALSLRRNVSAVDEKKIFKHLGEYYIKTDRLHKAITIFEELINLDRNNPEPYEKLLELYCKTERWQECKDLLKKLEKILPTKQKLAEYYAEYGNRILAKNPDEAHEFFKQALSFDNKSIPALVAMGDYYYHKGEIKDAIGYWKELLDYYPQNSHLVRQRLETAYYDLGQFEEIVNVYEKLLKKVPNDIELYLALARFYDKKEDIDSAIKILTQIPIDKKKEPEPQIYLASLYLKAGKENKAKQILDNLMESFKPTGKPK
ncbi:MAG: tetratricopeptide repeat protein [candidate division WOR-3 bacterium]|nr:tetratricopeptide repeat protein [candidate division WOR-3 bacterium]